VREWDLCVAPRCAKNKNNTQTTNVKRTKVSKKIRWLLGTILRGADTLLRGPNSEVRANQIELQTMKSSPVWLVEHVASIDLFVAIDRRMRAEQNETRGHAVVGVGRNKIDDLGVIWRKTLFLPRSFSQARACSVFGDLLWVNIHGLRILFETIGKRGSWLENATPWTF